jgi:hypothetical protein
MWCLEKITLPIYRGQVSVPLPVGAVDIMSMNLRQLNRELGEVDSASEGVAANAFDSDLDTACVQTIAAGYIQTQFPAGEPVQVDTFGIFFNATGTWDITIQGSNDGATWTDLYDNEEVSAAIGTWLWLDLEEQVPWEYFRLQANGATILNVAEFYLGNNYNEVPLGQVSLDSYSDLPNKMFLSRPTEYWFDMQAATPSGRNVATVWPAPDTAYTFYQYVLYVKRQIQDVGTLYQEVEVPQSWYEFIICDVARKLCRTIPEADLNRVQMLDSDFLSAEQKAWTGQDDGAPVFIQPNIGVYTK